MPSLDGLRLALVDVAEGCAATLLNAIDTWAAPLALLDCEGIKRLRLGGWGSGWESCGDGNKETDDHGELHFERRLLRRVHG